MSVFGQSGRFDGQIDRRSLHKALKLLQLPEQLGCQALARLPIVEGQRRQRGYPQSPAGYGLALKDPLLDAIAALAPEAGDANPQEKRWRLYLIATPAQAG